MHVESFKILGVQVYFIKKDSPTTHIQIRVGSGAMDDLTLGTAHFLEHMVFKGNTLLSTKDMNAKLDMFGYSNAATSRRSTCFYFTTIPDTLPQAAEVLFDVLSEQALDPNLVEVEKQIILEEARMRDDDPYQVFLDQVFEDSFGSKFQPIIGTQESIKNIDAKTLRDFSDIHYCKDNIRIIIAGPSYKSLESIIKRKGPKEWYKIFGNTSGKKRQNRKKVSFSKGDFQAKIKAKQSHILMFYKGFSIKESLDANLADSVLEQCLGGGTSSLLYSKVREELGLCYSTGAWSMFNGTDYMGAISAATSEVSKCRKAIESIVKDVKANGFDESTIEAAKHNLKFRIATQHETAASSVSYIVHHLDMNCGFLSAEEYCKKIDTICNGNLIDCARETLNGFKVCIMNP